MTKSEFDDAFLSRNVCILHRNKDEWEEICGYAATLGVKPQNLSAVSNGEHDCQTFPYAYVQPIPCRMSAASKASICKDVLSFKEFCSAINNDETIEFQCDDLNAIL